MLEWKALLAQVKLGQTHPLRATPLHPPFVTQCPAPPVNLAPTANSYRNKLEGGTTRSFFDRAESIRQVGGCDLFDLGGCYFWGLVSPGRRLSERLLRAAAAQVPAACLCWAHHLGRFARRRTEYGRGCVDQRG